MHAYNIARGERTMGEPDRRADGWCFGLPPGIAPEQWPLDPITRRPLMHGFTLKLTEDQRVHGPEIVGFSFIATSPEGNDGGPRDRNLAAEAIVDRPGGARPDDPALAALWDLTRQVHPRVHRMRDILDYGYAVLLLGQAEYDGACCLPPVPAVPPELLGECPAWPTQGSMLSFDRFEGHHDVADVADPLRLHRPLTLNVRSGDLNAGLAPRELYDDTPGDTGYRAHYYWLDDTIAPDNYRVHDWAKDHTANHLGGTMRPIQAVPEDFSAFYVGFEEHLGGYNFGGGNAQLDFKSMRVEWACG
ncbi:hypothetical protein [Sphingomonas prati]|uniref:Uncharacterized protein n=1 Tax=Sphingomonas prati TaxID=1843237 RepID=A0A7W9BVC1_9SPHN|nr:hypothetical protein [Sphingomonas prati]MBB5730806.1 hypothetical protein [Sphingomonas prati]